MADVGDNNTWCAPAGYVDGVFRNVLQIHILTLTLMAKRETQDSKAAKIRQWLMSGKPLTQWECTFRFKYLRLGALIHDMRRAGITIKTDMVEQENGGAYARYTVLQPQLPTAKGLNQ